VTDYTLFRNEGTVGSAWKQITSYTYLTDSFAKTLTLSSETMVAGRFYQFVSTATNVVGISDYSPVFTQPIADVPSKPTAPAFTSSTKTSLTVTWAAVANTQPTAGQLTGYFLYRDNG